MDEVATNHDQLQQTIAEQEAQSNCHPLMQKIDSWEQKSIDKIRQAADNARKELLTIISKHKSTVANALTLITQELNQTRNEDEYVEIDLKEWMERLDKLKIDLTATQTIDFGQDNNVNALISKIFINGVSDDFFERSIGDIQIIENSRVIVHGQTQQNAAVRGRGEYSPGQYRFRFKIEQLNGYGRFSCGIVSKHTSMESLLLNFNTFNEFKTNDIYTDCYNSPAFSAHNDNNHFYFTGLNQSNQTNDIIELLVDCDQRIIRFTNETTYETQTLNVQLSACPFPWQCFITLLDANDCFRLCEEKKSF